MAVESAARHGLRLLAFQCMAEDIFEKPEAASAWLSCGHPMLEGKAPLDWAKSAYGTERVKEILIALKQGDAV